MWLTILWHCCTVEWPSVNPNLCSGSSSSFGMAACILVMCSLSKILERSDKRLIGLYVFGCCGCLTGLAIMITRAYFHWSGKCPRRKMLLYKSNETPAWCNTVQVLFLQSYSTCFGRQAPIIRSFKTSTAATGTCVIVAGKSSHLLIRAFRP